MNDKKPRVSVVIVAGEVRYRGARALASVLGQEGIEDQEVIVIDAAATNSERLAGADHPLVRLFRPEGSMHFGQLRGQAVRLARGEVIAFVEDHVWAHPGWLRAIAASSTDGWAAIGPEVHPGNPGLGLSDAINLVNYGLWNPPLQRGDSLLLPGNNTAYRRAVLLEYGSQLDDLLLSDTVLQMRLKLDGHLLYAEPSARISHLSPVTFRTAATAEFLYHRCFVLTRAQTFAWSRFRRLEYLLRSPLIPWVRLVRLGGFVFRRRSEQRGLFLSQLVPTAALLHAAVLGQAAGLLSRRRESAAAQFTDFELNCPRPMASDFG